MRITIVLLILLLSLTRTPAPVERIENFDRDPGWEGINNRPNPKNARSIRQDFGYSPTKQTSSQPGEIGGFITPSAESAYYAKRIPTQSFQNTLTASGTFLPKNPKFHLLLGFFNATSTGTWRTPNSIVLRLQGRGDTFFVYVEYCTSRWRAGGDSPQGFVLRNAQTGRMEMKGFKRDTGVHKWTLQYDPAGNQGNGAITVTMDGETAICHLGEGHKADEATFNRFGLLNVAKSADDGGEVWLNDITINGVKENLARDPKWEAQNNRNTYHTTNIRPQGNFGYSPTHYAGGKAGELGGLVFRGDCRYAQKMGSYGDRLKTLDLQFPLKASGKISLRRGVSDSTVLIGFYNSQKSMTSQDTQKYAIPEDFLGAAIEGPSSEGFYFYPCYRFGTQRMGVGEGNERPHILPDGKTHTWSLEYTPPVNGMAQLRIELDGKRYTLKIPFNGDYKETSFNRFGIITTWIDGNGQDVYFDDLFYTTAQK